MVRSPDTAQVEKHTEEGDTVKGFGKIEGNKESQASTETSGVQAVLRREPTLKGAAPGTKANNLVGKQSLEVLA
jgi:hypothetical protein